MRTALCILAGALLCAIAHARSEDGSLGELVRPNSGAPAFVLSGETFEVSATTEVTLALRGPDGADMPIESTWIGHTGGLRQGVATVPPGCPAGLYDLVAGEDQNTRSVAVFDVYPTSYTILHLHAPAFGAEEGVPLSELLAPLFTPEPEPEPEVETEAETENTPPVAPKPTPVFLLLTGNLTQTGAPEEYQSLLHGLEAAPCPTVVLPGPIDGSKTFARFFGSLPAAFRFGNDGFLLLDTAGDRPLADESAEVGLLHRQRRELMDCRWTLAATCRYTSTIGVRAQLTLFVDDPLDGLVVGIDAPESPPRFPWGDTRILPTPPVAAGSVRAIGFGVTGFGAGGLVSLAPEK